MLIATESVALVGETGDLLPITGKAVMDARVTLTTHNFDSYVLRTMQMQFLDAGRPLCWFRSLNYCLTLPPDATLERLCDGTDWHIMRIDRGEAIIRSEHACLRLRFNYRGSETPCLVDLWAVSAAAGRKIRQRLEELALLTGEMARAALVDWIHPGRFSMEATQIQERFADVLVDAAYPWLPCAPAVFAKRYLTSAAPVLILLGPPGTGKTRLVRYLLGEMSRVHHKQLRLAYTADAKTVSDGKFFSDFMAQDYDAMVIEDADHLLRPRSDGNEHLHRFLAVSDGLLQPRGRRLIFTTNLPSHLDIDDALTRPGRCFASLRTRKLTAAETRAVIRALRPVDAAARAAKAALDLADNRKASLAEIYAAVSAVSPNRDHHGPQLPPPPGHAQADTACTMDDC